MKKDFFKNFHSFLSCSFLPSSFHPLSLLPSFFPRRFAQREEGLLANFQGLQLTVFSAQINFKLNFSLSLASAERGGGLGGEVD